MFTAPWTAVTLWLDGNLLRVSAGRTVTVEQRAAARMVTQGGPLLATQTTGPAGGMSVLTLVAAPRTRSAPVLVEDPRVAFRR